MLVNLAAQHRGCPAITDIKSAEKSMAQYKYYPMVICFSMVSLSLFAVGKRNFER